MNEIIDMFYLVTISSRREETWIRFWSHTTITSIEINFHELSL